MAHQFIQFFERASSSRKFAEFARADNFSPLVLPSAAAPAAAAFCAAS
jgi:hypothetical protein